MCVCACFFSLFMSVYVLDKEQKKYTSITLTRAVKLHTIHICMHVCMYVSMYI